MANQQLTDYVKQQLNLGVTKEVLRATLLESGWSEKDVKEVISDPPRSVQFSPSPASSMPGASAPAMMTNDVFRAKSVAPAVSTPTVTKSVSALPPQTDVAAPMFKKGPLPAISRGQQTYTAPSFAGAPVAKHPTAPKAILVLGGLTLILALFSGFLWKTKSDLAYEVRTLSADNASLSARVASAEKEARDAKEVSAAATASAANLAAQLSLFVITPSNTTSSEPMLITLRGTLTGSDKTGYLITTPEGIAVSVKNSKDAGIVTAFKNMGETVIEISGTHSAGSREITVTSINGSPVSN